jgi:hypothetical protein
MRKITLLMLSFAVLFNFAFAQENGSRQMNPDKNPQKPIPSQANVKGFLINETFDDITTLAAAGWNIQNLSTPVGTGTWFQGNPTVFAAHEGAGYIGVNFNSTAGAGTIDNWLITPEVDIKNGDVLTFWTRTGEESAYPDRLQVRMSEAGASTNVADFTAVLVDINPGLTVGGYPEAWTEYTLEISGVTGTVSGRFGFRYFVTNGGPSGDNSNYIGMDLLQFNSLEIPTYTVTFTVTDGTDAIEGATIAINEEELTTDASGVATIDLEDGEYAYTVTKEGFVTFEGTATVAGEALAVAVEMEADGPVTFPVTFTVIDQKELYTNIKFKGTPTGWATVAMVEEPTHTWTLTLQVEPGSHEWGAIEDDGSVDGIWLIEGPNPAFTVAADGTVTGQTSYTILAPGDKAVTFIVDISTLEGFDPEADFIDLAGSFTSWSGTDPFEVDAENANLYTWTSNADLRPGQILMFKFRLNGEWDPTEENPHQGAETPADPDGKLNRMFVVSDVEEENVYTAVWAENYTHNLGVVAAIADIEVEIGAVVADLNLPEMIEVELGVPSLLTGETVSLPVTWDTEDFSSATEGEVMLHGEIALSYEDVTYFNGYMLMAEVKVIITGTSVTTKPAFQLSVFPNPTSCDLNVVGGSQISSIRVMNMLGQQVMNVSNLGRENVTLSTSTLSAGIYIISVTDMNGATVSNRFVKR